MEETRAKHAELLREVREHRERKMTPDHHRLPPHHVAFVRMLIAHLMVKCIENHSHSNKHTNFY